MYKTAHRSQDTFMNNHYPFVNTPLPYGYDALEPFIDEKTMHLHHDRHLQTYIDNLNNIMEKNPSLQGFSLEELITRWCFLPKPLQTSVRNNAGGVYNHRFYFNGMAPARRQHPARLFNTADFCSHPNTESGFHLSFSEKMSRQFGSLEQFHMQFKEAALSVFGSGYTWLVLENGQFVITTSANQDTPLSRNQYPILNIDVWEHAYYLKHYNVRAAYIDDWFRVVDWRMAKDRYDRSQKLCINF